MKNTNKNLLSLAEAAKMLSFTKNKLSRFSELGRINSLKTEEGLFFKKMDIEKYLTPRAKTAHVQNCAVCGKDIGMKRKNAKTCSTKCRSNLSKQK